MVFLLLAIGAMLAVRGRHAAVADGFPSNDLLVASAQDQAGQGYLRISASRDQESRIATGHLTLMDVTGSLLSDQPYQATVMQLNAPDSDTASLLAINSADTRQVLSCEFKREATGLNLVRLLSGSVGYTVMCQAPATPGAQEVSFTTHLDTSTDSVHLPDVDQLSVRVDATHQGQLAPISSQITIDASGAQGGDSYIYQVDCGNRGPVTPSNPITRITKNTSLCSYSLPGIYQVHVVVRAGDKVGEAILPVTAKGLSVKLTPDQINAVATETPFVPVVKVEVQGGTASGDYSYDVYCNYAGATQGKSVPVTGQGSSFTYSSCSYTQPGVNRLNIVAHQGGAQGSSLVDFFLASPEAQLKADLKVENVTGSAPFSPKGTVTVSGTASGITTYQVFCDWDGTAVTAAHPDAVQSLATDAKSGQGSQSFQACAYTKPGIYAMRIVMQRGKSLAQSVASITVR